MKRIALAIMTACALYASAAQADDYPSRTIKLVMPLPAGTTGFLIARTFASLWEQELGVPVVVEPKPGAFGLISAKYVANAQPDGYTVGLLLSPNLSKDAASTDYDPRKFAFSTFWTRNELYIAVPSSSPIKNIGDLIKANPGLYGVVTVGGRYEGIKFAKNMGLDSKAYPSSESSILLDLKTGRVGYSFIFDRDAREWSKSGDVRLLAIVAQNKSRFLPELPTLAEALRSAGKQPYPTFPFFTMLAFPPGTPPAILERFSTLMCKASQSEIVKTKVSPLVYTSCSTPQQAREIAERAYKLELPVVVK